MGKIIFGSWNKLDGKGLGGILSMLPLNDLRNFDIAVCNKSDRQVLFHCYNGLSLPVFKKKCFFGPYGINWMMKVSASCRYGMVQYGMLCFAMYFGSVCPLVYLSICMLHLRTGKLD